MHEHKYWTPVNGVYYTGHFSFKFLGSTVYSILGTHSMSPAKGFFYLDVSKGSPKAPYI